MMIITFLCHAQSESNLHWDTPNRDTTLTPLGLQQSMYLTGHFDVVFCSPLRRARDTLSKSNITYDELIIAPEVRECVYSVDDIIIDENVPDSHFETDEEIAERCRKLYRMLVAKSKECSKKTLVLSHYGFICEFTSRYCNHRVCLEVGNLEEIEVTHSHDRKSHNGNKNGGHLSKSTNHVRHSSTSALSSLSENGSPCNKNGGHLLKPVSHMRHCSSTSALSSFSENESPCNKNGGHLLKPVSRMRHCSSTSALSNLSENESVKSPSKAEKM